MSIKMWKIVFGTSTSYYINAEDIVSAVQNAIKLDLEIAKEYGDGKPTKEEITKAEFICEEDTV